MTVEQLQTDPNYDLLLILHHDEVLPFVQGEFGQGTFTIRFFIFLNLLLLAFIGCVAWQDIANGALGWVDLLLWFGIGTVLVFVLLIPPHEMIHGIAYQLVGAPKVSYGVNWKKFYFYAVADNFVVNRKSFIFIALAPFFVISLFAVLTLFCVSLQMKWVLLGVLFMHTGACAGDFAMLSFYERHRHFSELLTFDMVQEKISFFYVKNE